MNIYEFHVFIFCAASAVFSMIILASYGLRYLDDWQEACRQEKDNND